MLTQASCVPGGEERLMNITNLQAPVLSEEGKIVFSEGHSPGREKGNS